MLNFTPNQWAIIALVLVLGWLLGLMSRSGGGRWKRELAEERAAHAKLRADHDARINAANTRIAELERQAPPTGLAGGTIGAAAAGRSDDLSRISGIDRAEESRLNGLGIHSYRDIESLSAADEAALEGRMGAEPGFIERERWREQAAKLRKG